MYNNLLKVYQKSNVAFVMYDLFNYDHQIIGKQKKRNDDTFKRDVLERYNNECIITGTDMPCNVFIYILLHNAMIQKNMM